MAEWLRRGLQILARRFDSGSGLHFSQQCESAALAQLVEHIIRNDGVTGSSPVSGTIHGRGRKAPSPLQLHRRMNEKKRERGPAFARERCGSARRVAK